MCDAVLARLVSGEPLLFDEATHAETCPRCRAARAAIEARPAPVSLPRLAPPAPARLRAASRRRVATRAGLAAAALALVALALRPDPEPLPTVEPDLIALIDEVDALSSAASAEPPGAEALAFLDPLPDPLSDDPFFDLIDPRRTP